MRTWERPPQTSTRTPAALPWGRQPRTLLSGHQIRLLRRELPGTIWGSQDGDAWGRKYLTPTTVGYIQDRLLLCGIRCWRRNLSQVLQTKADSNNPPCKWLSLLAMATEVTHLFLFFPEAQLKLWARHSTQPAPASSRLPPSGAEAMSNKPVPTHALSARTPQVSPRTTKDALDTPRSVCMDDLAMWILL